MDIGAKLKAGGVGVLATDTVYGLVARAFDRIAVERVYALKGRASTKPCIILISDISDLKQFGVVVGDERERILARFWPGPVSMVLPVSDAPEYLHRGTQTLAFRLPNDERLLALLKETGPLIAPSANPEGAPPATTIIEAKNYFGDAVDFYDDAGERAGAPSTLISLDEDNAILVLR